MKKTDNGKKFLRLRLFNSISDIKENKHNATFDVNDTEFWPVDSPEIYSIKTHVPFRHPDITVKI